ncbi:MAG: RluA family pseudouridine synthase [Candidatus Omnitrophica bacterium]|nr:RluA family pseudouridine synthase [Candidatus Omnitrophota bacterium]
MSTHTLIVNESDEADIRVDVFVTRALPDVIPSRMFVKRLFDEGRLLVNGKVVKQHYKVHVGDEVVLDVRVEDYPDERIKPENVPLDIVYEDECMIALNKAVGVAVHPAAGHYGGTLVNALVHHFGSLSDMNGAKRPGIVHRLDKETSGILLVAKNNMAHARLAKQFEAHTIEKKYVALVEGEVQFDEGVVEAPIGEHPRYHDLRCIAREGEGRPATTYYNVAKRHKGCTAVALFPTTGRTHQLRLHMRHLRHAILGDEKYGNKGNFSRLALHAQSIFFEHPLSKEPMEISVPLPSEFLPYF